MKRKIVLSIALALSIVLVSLMVSDSTVEAQRNRLHRYDSGTVTLGVNQKLVVTAVDASLDADIVFHEFGYVRDPCTADGVCRLTIASQHSTALITLLPGEAVIYDGGDTGTHEVRRVAVSNSPNVRVTATIIDTVTNKVVTSWATFPN